MKMQRGSEKRAEFINNLTGKTYTIEPSFVRVNKKFNNGCKNHKKSVEHNDGAPKLAKKPKKDDVLITGVHIKPKSTVDEYLNFLVVVSQIEGQMSEKSFAQLQFSKMANVLN